MPRANPQTPEADARAPSASTRQPDRSQQPKPADARGESKTDAAVAVADKDASGVEVPGRRDTPPPAHGSDVPPPPPSWSFPSGLIAGREIAATRNAPLSAPVNPSLGPEGRRRSPIMVVVLSVMTLGIYALVWHSRINTEIGDFDTRMYVRPGRSTLAVAIAWLIGLLTSIAGAVIIVTSQMQVSLPYNAQFTMLEEYLLLGGLLAVPYVILAVPFSLISMVMTLERIRIAEDRAGRPTDAQLRPARTVWWLAVPVVGGLILQTLMQRRLNQVWELVSPLPAARISSF